MPRGDARAAKTRDLTDTHYHGLMLRDLDAGQFTRHSARQAAIFTVVVVDDSDPVLGMLAGGSAAPPGLRECLQQVVDPRRRRGVRHSIVAVVKSGLPPAVRSARHSLAPAGAYASAMRDRCHSYHSDQSRTSKSPLVWLARLRREWSSPSLTSESEHANCGLGEHQRLRLVGHVGELDALQLVREVHQGCSTGE